MDDIKTLNLDHVLNDFCEEYVRRLKEILEQNGHRASGDLIKSLRTAIVTSSTTIKVVLISANYLRYVDYGRKAGKKPPVGSIRKWVEEKHLNPTGERYDRLPTEKKLDALAYAIKNSIGEKGTLAKYGYGAHGGAYSDRVLDELLPKYKPLFENALYADFEIVASAYVDELAGAIKV